MYKQVKETKIIQTIGQYTIVKSIEQTYWNNGVSFGKPQTWYDICLNNGDEDIIASYDKLNSALKWAKEN